MYTNSRHNLCCSNICHFGDFRFAHFLIHCNRLIMDSTSSCPFEVRLYSTLGGISLYDCLSNIPPFSNSFSLKANVLLLTPFNSCLNCLCLTGLVVQHSGINISRVPRFVINFLILAVSFIRRAASYPSKLHSLITGTLFTPRLLVSIVTPSLFKSSYQFK